jgi:hypothetical protein
VGRTTRGGETEMKKVNSFTLHNGRNQSVPNSELLNWRKYYPNDESDIFGPVITYSWYVDDLSFRSQYTGYWCELPDASGFICFEREWKPDNCLLLDVYGKERIRLIVPWQLTRHPNPESEKPPTSFDNISEPYVNPTNGMRGKFGVAAWVEYAGKYYFELDYQTGQFLWGREIRD